MAIKISAPLIQVFELTKSDLKYGEPGASPTTVTIRQARKGHNDRRRSMIEAVERRYNSGDGDIRFIQSHSLSEIHAMEVFLTLVSSNMLGPDGELLFPSRTNKGGELELALDEREFLEAWKIVFDDVADEILEKVHELNLGWENPWGEVD